jgi:hypothetical protein
MAVTWILTLQQQYATHKPTGRRTSHDAQTKKINVAVLITELYGIKHDGLTVER